MPNIKVSNLQQIYAGGVELFGLCKNRRSRLIPYTLVNSIDYANGG
ncbi:MAG: hypothetical protein HN820_06490 [Candidatus Marinimicrobia bacterium]|nr:hypothetical protein [Candidatus Neomarinimicrobiota bacterium]MBT5956145.1 hypothetical protein [Candidatus Neomarinimicrobiota bacterium]MBT6871269.1 hypothetical protein [Candidatus Neomarinimicrobiota bacterium]MBT7377787.1 hypothetical protein [Candidatus Neomarinimicrobiota bacterium]